MSVQSTTGSRGVPISGSNAEYTMFRGSVKSTGYPLHSPVPPFTSPPLRHRVPSNFTWSLPCSDTVRCRLDPPVVSGLLKRKREFITRRSNVCCTPLDYYMSESHAECHWSFGLAFQSRAFGINQSCAAFMIVFVRHALWTPR